MQSVPAVSIATALANARDWTGYAACLKRIQRESGLTLKQVESAARSGLGGPGRRDLPTSTVSDLLAGKRPIGLDVLTSLLTALKVPGDTFEAAGEAWRRINSQSSSGPLGAGRFYEATPWDLGISASIRVDHESADLPPYVPRDFDDGLRTALGDAANSGQGCFVLLVGDSATGKTRSLFEAAGSQINDWWLVQPADTKEIQALAQTPVPNTILWLDELHRYLGAVPPLTREIASKLMRSGMILAGTIWNEQFTSRRTMRRDHADEQHGEDKRLFELCRVFSVPRALSRHEHGKALQLQGEDARLREALAVTDAEFTQALAGAPELMHRWEHAPTPYAKAIITAAADARRLGVHQPLPTDLLAVAAAGYLTAAERVTAAEQWLKPALEYGTDLLKGAVAPLTPAAGPRLGTLAGYVVADYLVQHVRRARRNVCPPPSLWNALICHASDPTDLWRLSQAAIARLRYDYAEQVLRCLPDNSSAVVELATVLRRQARLDEALTVVDQRLAVVPQDEHCRLERTHILELRERATALRNHGGPRAQQRIDELLADGGKADRLRTRASGGDMTAADELADMLADTGSIIELRELADAGSVYARGRLAEFSATADSDHPRLGFRDVAVSPSSVPNGHVSVADQDLDEAASAARVTDLFDACDVAGLLAEVNAGTAQAASRLLALLASEEVLAVDQIAHLRSHGLNAVDLTLVAAVKR